MAIVAVHARTAEAITAIASVHRVFGTSRFDLRDVIVFVDEAEVPRAATISALSAIEPPPTTITNGDGEVYWARAFEQLLRAALVTGADFVLHLNTDVVLTANPDPLFDPMCNDSTIAAVSATLDGDVRLTGYHRARAWFPFFRSVAPGAEAAYLPASCIAIRAHALTNDAIELDALGEYRHGWADIELSCQLSESGFRLLTTPEAVGRVAHRRYFRRQPNFDRFDGSFVRYVRECPTAPCWADTKRLGARLFGRLWFVLLRVYVPVIIHYVRYRIQRLRGDTRDVATR